VTVLAAWVVGPAAYMAADSGLVGGVEVEESRVWPDVQKIRPVQVGVQGPTELAQATALVGAAGNASAGPIAWYEVDPPRAPAARDLARVTDATRAQAAHDYEISLDRWAFLYAVALDTAARDACLTIGGDSDRPELTDAAWMIGFRGRVWTASQHSARRVDRMTAIGTGGAYALGALAALDPAILEGLQPRLAIERAVNVACRYDAYCRGPAQVEQVPA
jgi:hypothetical protein